VRELGSGGNGVAFLCQATETDSLVAKVYIPPDSRDLDERAYKRFKNEISLNSKMQHPNVIKALGSGIIEIGAYSLPSIQCRSRRALYGRKLPLLVDRIIWKGSCEYF
jgi:serine/threonine protein kinase